MKVAHVHSSTDTGGAAAVARTLVDQQRRAGIDAHLIAGWGRGDPDQGIHSLESGRRVNAANAGIFRLTGIEGALSGGTWRRMLAAPLMQNADLIHLHNAHGYYLPPAALRRLLAKPAVWTLHDHWLTTGRCAFPGDCTGNLGGCRPCPHRARYPAVLLDRAGGAFHARRRMLGDARAVLVAPTEAVRQAFAAAGLAAERIRIIPNPVAIPVRANPAESRERLRRQLGIQAEDRLVMFAAPKLTDPRKGLAVLAEAVAALGARPRLKLVFAGAADKSTRQAIARLPAEARIVGFVSDRGELADLHRAADALVAPSFQETFGLAIVEAAANGAALIASDLPVFREVIGNAELPWAYMFPAGDAQALAHCLDRFLDRPVRPDSAEQARLLQRYDPARAAAAYVAAYRDALAI